MFLAGLVFVVLFNWLTSIKMELYLVGIWSLFANALIKYVYSSIHAFFLIDIDFEEHLKIVIYVFTAVLSAFLFARVYNSNSFKRILIKVGKKTLGNNVFKDIIDFDKKTLVSVYPKDLDCFYIGTFKYMDEHEGDSYIALIEYSICNRVDNSIVRNSSNNKMSMVICLRDIEHIEFLYEDNSDVWKLIDGNDKVKDTKKDESVNKKRIYLVIQKVVNRLGLVIPVMVFCIFAGTLGYFLFYQSMSVVANVIDFIVAMMSVIVLIISFERTKMDERKQYLWVSSVYILLLTVGLIAFIVIAINVKNISSLARVLSCICLGITIIQEIISIIKIEYKINIEGENKQEAKIKQMESENDNQV